MSNLEQLPRLVRDFGAHVAFPPEQWTVLERRVRVQAVPKGTLLLRQGEPVHWLGFLERGILRNFQTVEGREVNLGFECEGGYIGAYADYQQQKPASVGIETLEDCLIARFDRPELDALLASHACWRELSARATEIELARRIELERDARTRTPQQRYAELERSQSFLVRRVPLYHLASYLGVAPETLSRIRARLGGAGSAPGNGGS